MIKVSYRTENFGNKVTGTTEIKRLYNWLHEVIGPIYI